MTYELTGNPGDTDDTEDHERYLCTDEELEAGGFTVWDIPDMPETDAEPIGRRDSCNVL
jgi:hypothetical protein